MHPSALLFAATLCAAALAQDSVPPAFAAPGNLIGVHIDVQSDGAILVLAPGYKARFARGSVEYHPYFGPHAPRNFPVTLRLVSARRGASELPIAPEATPAVAARRITFDHGGIVETWDLDVWQAEQSFALAKPDGEGDLVLEVAVTTGLACVDVASGLSFVAPGFGEVRYGDVLTIAGARTQVESESRWRDDRIELRVPDAFLDAAQGTLVVDPLVSTFTIDAGSDDNRDPDVAYEPGSDCWLVVYERAFSSFDIDIVGRRYTGAGTLLEETVIAGGTRESLNPSVAANAGARQFLVAWDEDRLLDRIVLGRTRSAVSTAQGTEFLLRDASGLANQNPVVGGSAATDAENNRYLVGCDEGDFDAAWLVVTTTSAVSFSQQSPTQRNLAVTKVRQTGLPWLIAFHVAGRLTCETFFPLSGSGQRVTVNGTVGTRPPAVAGSRDRFLVVHEVPVAGNGLDVIGVLLSLDRGAFLTLGAQVNLSVLESGVTVSNDQRGPSVSCDGCRFTYAYVESRAGGSTDPFAATVFFEGQIPVFMDAHQRLQAATSTESEDELAIAGMGDIGGAAGRTLAVFQRRVSASDHDVIGARYDGVAPGTGATFAPTGCGGLAEPAITVSGPPALGATISIDIARLAPANTFILVGLPGPSVPLCAAGCQLGLGQILSTVAGSATLPLTIPCDRNIVGARLAAQGLVLGFLSGCGPPVFGVSFVVSDTVTLTIG